MDRLKIILKGLKAQIPGDARGDTSRKTVHELIDAMVADEKATEKALNSFIDRCNLYLQNRKGGTA